MKRKKQNNRKKEVNIKKEKTTRNFTAITPKAQNCQSL